ncbi:phage holin family protein [Tessaracoccus sp. HDW20]|uniref:phage holin family protein n=1 Tax=Tessaracoccus coleopterorum TaxID=2714950 RepID=UPI0018D31F14|nr:phage holin family protein [Tessaracoccus coleopterorum]NHB84093.1 phage holin family protein [Tessaracoccus coleopterorum]
MRFLMRLIVTALATAVAVWLVPGIHLGSDNQVVTLLLVALIFGLVNAIIKPLVTVVSTCLVVLSLGLFMLVINAGMLLLTSWLAGNFGLGFHVAGFWPALWGSLIISVVGAILGGLLGNNREHTAS